MKSQFFKNIIFLDTIESTNTYLKHNDIQDRTIVFTFNQTHGRGRNNRLWIGFNQKSLAISFLIKSEYNFKNHTWLIACSSLALIELLENSGIKKCWIKWPNDVYVGDRKISGILAESIWKGQNLDKVIIGIGININCTKEDLISINKSATSVLIQTDKSYDLNLFFSKYLEILSRFLILFYKGDFLKIKKAWFARCKIINKNVEWIKNNDIIYGKIIDVDIDGYLVIETNNNKIKIYDGEVKIV